MDKEVMEVVGALKGATIKETLVEVGEMCEVQSLTLTTTDGKQIVLTVKGNREMQMFMR